jgi:hypothetical protein
MTKSVCKFAVLFAAFVACGFCQSKEARAAEVTLTSGSVVVNCPPSENSRTGTIQLNGPDFDLHFFYDGSGASCSPAPVRRSLSGGPAYDLSFYEVTFQGVRTLFTQGFLVFDETSISGVVEGTDSLGQSLFIVNFTGAGVGNFSPSRSTFEVGAVPEPATLALLSVGVAALGAARRYKARRTQKSQKLS